LVIALANWCTDEFTDSHSIHIAILPLRLSVTPKHHFPQALADYFTALEKPEAFPKA
jgi:hypothetical protein